MTVTWTFQRSSTEEVEAVYYTDIDRTNESDLRGVHSEEINTTSRILLSICMVGFDHEMR